MSNMAKSTPAWEIALNEAGPVRRSKAEQEGFYKKAFQIVKDRWRAQGKLRNDGDLSRKPIPGSKYSDADNYWNAFDKEVEAELDKFPGIWTGSIQEGNIPKVNGFSAFKKAAKEWASYNTPHGEPDFVTSEVGSGSNKWFQTRSIGETRSGQRFIIGVFNHKNGRGSEEGFGTHHSPEQSLNEAVYGSAPNQPYIAYSESDRVTLENSLKQAFPWVEVIRQTLGGEARASLAVRVSADSKESWNRGIFQNSRYCIFDLSNGKLEALSLDRSWAGMRKTAVGSPALAAQKIIEWAKRKGLLGVNESASSTPKFVVRKIRDGFHGVFDSTKPDSVHVWSGGSASAAQKIADKYNDKNSLTEAAVPLAIQKQVAQAFLSELPIDVRSKLQSSVNLTPEESVNAGLKHAFDTFGTPNAVELKRLAKMLHMVKQLGIQYDTNIIPAKYRAAILESKETPMTKKKSSILNLINEVTSQASLIKLSPPSPVTGYFQYLIKYDPTRGFEILSGTKHLAWARSIGDAKKYIDDNLPKDKVFNASGSFSVYGGVKESAGYNQATDREPMNTVCPECGESWKVCNNIDPSGKTGYIFCMNCGHHKDCHKPGVLGSEWKMSRSLKEGKVIKEDIHGTVISEAEKKGEKCPTCKGYGFTGDGSPGDSDEDDSEGNCKTCKGKGRIAEETEADWRKFHDKVAPGTPFRSFHKYVPGPQELCIAKLENGKPCNGSKGSVVHQKKS